MLFRSKKEKEHTAQQREGNQETKLREDINSERRTISETPTMRPLQKTALVGLSNDEQIHRLHLKGHIEYLASLDEISWRQKSRALFVKEGNNNT